MIPISHKLTQPRADGTVFKLYANERIIANYAAMTSTPCTVEPLAAQHGSAVQSPPTRREASVPNDDLLSVEQAARELSRSQRAVRLYIERGLLKAEKIGISWVIRRSDLEKVKGNLPKMGRPKTK